MRLRFDHDKSRRLRENRKRYFPTRTMKTADEIAEMADSGRDISRFFTNQGTMKQPLTSISIEITQEMLQELDQLAAALRISRQAAINSCLRKALDQRLLAERGET